ncbi:MAG: DUF4058 family protein [Anaerolineae bacterium]|nr:DUF4058 family protein [Anaerolineae bacterium]
MRGGEVVTVISRQAYCRIPVSRSYRRPRADLYIFSVREPIPIFRLHLRRGYGEPLVDLGRLLYELYDRAGL